ncbi:MAG: hypothetical protein U0X73_08475 [Thermoanaerobaculia bacterium]
MNSSLDRNGIWSAKVVGVMGHMLPGKEESVSEDTTLAIDLAKSVFEIAVSTRPGMIAERRRLSRAGRVGFLSTLPPATVLLEACGTAHFWARELERFGHRVTAAAGAARAPLGTRSCCGSRRQRDRRVELLAGGIQTRSARRHPTGGEVWRTVSLRPPVGGRGPALIKVLEKQSVVDDAENR